MASSMADADADGWWRRATSEHDGVCFQELEGECGVKS